MICAVQQLGLVDYAEAIGLQREKVAARKADAVPDLATAVTVRVCVPGAALIKRG